MSGNWLHVSRGDAPLIVSIPHAGTELPSPFDDGLVSPERARKDADWHVDRLYAAAGGLGATLIRTDISRTIVDVNRDPSGASLYPGQFTTGLCPVETFDGEPLYRDGRAPDETETRERCRRFHEPYHRALRDEVERLRSVHRAIVLYEAHSIRSSAPLLFEGTLPELNIGTNGGASCAPELGRAVEALCAASGRSFVLNGRFRGGWTTRRYGRPAHGVHAIQMETAMRFYLDEQDCERWPPAWDEAYAAPARRLVGEILRACIAFAAAQA